MQLNQVALGLGQKQRQWTLNAKAVKHCMQRQQSTACKGSNRCTQRQQSTACKDSSLIIPSSINPTLAVAGE